MGIVNRNIFIFSCTKFFNKFFKCVNLEKEKTHDYKLLHTKF